MSPNVIARHRGLAEIVRERGDAQRKPVARAQTERLANFVGDRRDARRVRIRILLELISLSRQVPENFNRRDLIDVVGFN